MRVYLYDFLRFYCSFNNINELKKQLIIAFEPKEINIILMKIIIFINLLTIIWIMKRTCKIMIK